MAFTNRSVQNTLVGRNWLKNDYPTTGQRNIIIEILNYIASLENIENILIGKKKRGTPGYWLSLLGMMVYDNCNGGVLDGNT